MTINSINATLLRLSDNSTIWVPPVTEPARAFPGAEGMGALAIGGRNVSASVYKVTLLTDTLPNGIPGEFRYAVGQAGPRYVVFDVSGYINLSDEIEITNDFITIAGQTSPGGICTTGWPVNIKCNNAIVRHMRFRRGSHSGNSDDYQSKGESLYITDTLEAIIDHCSISWGTDETAQVSSWSGRARGITFSHCIISQGLEDPHTEDEHGYAFNFSDKISSGAATNPPECSFKQNYFVMHNGRAPQIKGNVLCDYVNNVTYFGDERSAPSLEKGSSGSATSDLLPRANWVGNFYQPSPGNLSNPNYTWGFVFSNALVSSAPDIGDRERIYVKDNRGPARPNGTEPQWRIASSSVGETAIRVEYEKPTPWVMADEAQFPGLPITQEYAMDSAVSEAQSRANVLAIIAKAGAKLPVVDSHDQEMIDALDFTNYPNNLSGSHKPNVSYPADFPTFSNPTPPVDSNNDGIPDSWDLAHGYTTNGGDDPPINSILTSGECIARGIDTKHTNYSVFEAYINENT